MTSWAAPTLAVAVLLASVPFTSAQTDSDRQGPIEMTGTHAEGRFVAFDVDADAGAVCDWSFEGQTVIKAMTGVSGKARAEGRVVMMEGGSSSPEDACTVRASDEDQAEDEEDEDDDATSTSRSASGSASTSRTMTSDADNDDPPSSTSASRSAPPTQSQSARVAAAKVKLHDNPNGAIAIDLDAGQTVRLDLASGLSVRSDEGTLRVQGDGLSASLFLSKGSTDVDVSVKGSTILLKADDAAKVHFRVEDRDLDDDDREAVEEHRDDGDVACEVFVSDDDEPDVVEIDGANVSVRSTHTSVSVDLDIDIDVGVHVGGDSDGTTSTTRSTTTATRTSQAPPPTQSATRTQTANGGGSGGGGDGASGCGCAAKVVILDVDVTVFVLEADADLLVRLNGALLARADSVEDALTIEVGEDPEALVVVNQEDEVKVITSLATGSSRLTLEAKGGEEFQTREPVRRTHSNTMTLDDEDDGLLPVNDVDVDDSAASRETREGGKVDVPGFGLGLATVALVAVALLSVRRRLE